MNRTFQTFRRLLPFLLIILFSLFSFCKAAEIEGIVLAAEGPLANATVYAYPDFASLAAHSGGFKSVPGEKPGQYRLQLPAGTYYLVARGVRHGERLFSYHGLNPVAIEESYRWLPLFAVKESIATYKQGPQGIGGRVTYKGQPLAGGVVSVYSRGDSGFRGMGLLSNTLDDSGRFWFDLEQGEYVIVARKRLGNSNMGPLRKGDFFCYPHANPIAVLPANSADIDISCYPRDDIESFLESSDLDPRGRRQPTRRTASLWDTQIKDASRIRQEIMLQRPVTVAGTVKDLAGRPVPDLYVTAYPADQFPLFQMFVIRLISDHMVRTDANGQYALELEVGGTYYLVAREKIGEAPDHPELYGLYEGNANHCITVRPGTADSPVDITVERIMP